PLPPGTPRITTSDNRAILLHDVQSANFAKLSLVFYNPQYSLYDVTINDWSTILDLAHSWRFKIFWNASLR
ncbi:hypothetical protein GGX14DRAFT_315943, partial [Mycena pura]